MRCLAEWILEVVLANKLVVLDDGGSCTTSSQNFTTAATYN